MKELSIEEKAKAYDEAIERAKEKYAMFEGMKQGDVLEDVFPELKESEGERIRKYLKRVFGEWSYDDLFEKGFKKEDIMTWLEKQGQTFTKKDIDDAYLKGVCDAKHELEKQGEQKPILDVEIPFGTDSELVEEAITIPDGCYAIIEDNKVILRKGEKKSSWSEEDKEMLTAITCSLDSAKLKRVWGKQTEDINTWLESLRPQNWTKEDKERYISCLQRLGTGNPEQPETINSKWFKEYVYPQCRWKPSKEQMTALENAIRYGEEESIGILSLLYNDLKKLREE